MLDELATLVLSHRDHTAALEALDRVRQSAVTIVYPDEADFDAAYEQFRRYDNHEISFTDHMSGVLAMDQNVDYIFTFDSNYFRTLGFTVVPDDTGET
jgi:uncharacterized protein